MEGSFKTMPCSGAKMTVLTVPRSIAKSSAKKLLRMFITLAPLDKIDGNTATFMPLLGKRPIPNDFRNCPWFHLLGMANNYPIK
jgi:hypothetical protein